MVVVSVDVPTFSTWKVGDRVRANLYAQRYYSGSPEQATDFANSDFSRRSLKHGIVIRVTEYESGQEPTIEITDLDNGNRLAMRPSTLTWDDFIITEQEQMFDLARPTYRHI